VGPGLVRGARRDGAGQVPSAIPTSIKWATKREAGARVVARLHDDHPAVLEGLREQPVQVAPDEVDVCGLDLDGLLGGLREGDPHGS
jgi:hypothetical protein